MQNVRVLWYSGGSLISSLIKRVTGSPYSHVAIDVDGYLYEALARGIVRRCGRDREERIAEAAASVELPVCESDLRQMLFWLNDKVSKGYSLLGFLFAGISAIFPRIGLVVSLRGEYICSGLVATALQIGGYLPLAEPRLETPASLAKLFDPVERKESGDDR